MPGERRTFGYCRVSTDQQVNRGVSLADQESRVRAYCDLYGLHLVEMVTDAGESAKTLKRPGMSRVLDAIRRREIDAVVAVKLDRLTRSVRDLGDLIDLAERAGVALVSVEENLDTSSASGRLIVHIMASVSQWEREAIGERTAAALAFKRRRGEWTGGPTTPLGYDLHPDGVHLVENSGEQGVIRLARRLRRDGRSLRAIGRELDRRGFTPKLGGTWSPAQISRACSVEDTAAAV